jgi:hypothetical protein
VKGFLEGYFSMHKPFVNVVQHLRDFGCFEMNKRDLSRQRQHILVAEVRLANHLGVYQFVVWSTLKDQGLHPYNIQKVQALKPEDLPSMFHFMRLVTIAVFLLCCLSLCCFLNKLLALLSSLYKFYQKFIMKKEGCTS